MNQLRLINLSNCFALIIGLLIFTGLISNIYGQENLKQTLTSKTTDIIISEISDPLTNKGSRFIELYNPTESAIDLYTNSYYLCRQANAGAIKSILLTGLIQPASTYLCIYDESSFTDIYGAIWDQSDVQWGMNGNDSFFLVKGGGYGIGTNIDTYGQYGVNGSGEGWEYSDAHAVRKRDIINPSEVWNADEWIIISGGSDQMTPGIHAFDTQSTCSSGSWNYGANWDGMNYVPDASANVIVSSFNNLSIDASSACNQVLIESDGILSLSANIDLLVVDELTNDGGVESFILNSDASGNSSLIHYSDSCLATVYSYFPELNYWYLVSPPVKDDFAGVFFNQYLDYWDEPAETWESIEDENYSLQAGCGYSVKKSVSNTAIYQGNLNNGTIIIDSLRYTASNTPDLRGWNLIGNPYPSVLDFKEVNVSGKQINAGISVWPHNGTESSSYISWSQGGGNPVGNEEARYIQPGQGFMIQVAADMESFELTNDCRTHQDLGTIDKDKSSTSNQINTLTFEIIGDNNAKDFAYFALREGASDEFDLTYDVRKMFGSAINPHVYFFAGESDNEKLAISCVSQVETNDYYYIGVKAGLEGNYTIKVNGINSFDNQSIWIVDELSQDIYDLKSDSIIQFFWQNGQTNKRFKLVFDEEVSINNLSLKTLEILTYVRDSRLYFSGTELNSSKTHVQIYNFLGQKVKDESVLQLDDGIELNLSSGYYWAYIMGDEENYLTKFFMP